MKASEQRLAASEARLAASEAKISAMATEVSQAGAIITENKKNLSSLVITVQAIEDTQAKTDKALLELGSLKELKNQMTMVAATSEKIVEATSKASREAQQAAMHANEAAQNTLKNFEAIAAIARPQVEHSRLRIFAFYEVTQSDLEKDPFLSGGMALFAIPIHVPGELKVASVQPELEELEWLPSPGNPDGDTVTVRTLRVTALRSVFATAISNVSGGQPGLEEKMFPGVAEFLRGQEGGVVILAVPEANAESLRKLLEFGSLVGQVRVILHEPTESKP